MTDFEIIKKVAELRGYKVWDGDVIATDPIFLNDLVLIEDVKGRLKKYNPFTDISEAMSIIIENWITIHQDPVNAFRWVQHGDIIEHDTDNVLRAAMKVFIRMKENG